MNHMVKSLCHFSPVMKTAILNFPSVCKTKFWKFILVAATNRKCNLLCLFPQSGFKHTKLLSCHTNYRTYNTINCTRVYFNIQQKDLWMTHSSNYLSEKKRMWKRWYILQQTTFSIWKEIIRFWMNKQSIHVSLMAAVITYINKKLSTHNIHNKTQYMLQSHFTLKY